MRKGCRSCLLVPLALAFLSACKVGPNYKRPELKTPPEFRSAPAAQELSSFGDRKWVEVFQDKVLQGLVQEALAANWDVKVAAQRVLAADGQLQATRSGLFPQIGARGQLLQQRRTGSGLNQGNITGSVAWEIDLFGKIRRASEAASAEMRSLSADEDAVRQLLVSQTATAYFQLRELDQEFLVLQESLKTRRASLRLVTARMTGGVSTVIDVDQAQSLVHQAEAALARVEKGIEQTENLLNFLAGRPPGPVTRGNALGEQYAPVEVPAGLPSNLIERRPDLRSAEQRLVAANARVGVAKAAFFPSINLTGSGGYQSISLTNLIDREGPVYGFGGTVDLPIFDFGRRSGNYKSSKAEAEAALQLYLKAIDNSFREVADALVGRRKAIEEREKLHRLVETLRHQSRIADMRYRGGVSSYLEVLDTERQRLDAEQDLSRGQLEEMLSLVQIYKALGGGWQQ